MRDFFLARGLTLTQIACMTPATLRSFGFNVKDREHEKGIGYMRAAKGYGSTSSKPPRTREGKVYPGGRHMRRVLAAKSA